MKLPAFKYHPDPLSTGSVIMNNARCRCCGETRGYIYTSNVYSIGELSNKICPWCIADGSAAKKYNATFVDGFYLHNAGIDPSIILEVTTRTPGFESWQGEVWLTHCNDACAFLGDATNDDVLSIAYYHLRVVGGEGIDSEMMKTIAQNYIPKSSPAFCTNLCAFTAIKSYTQWTMISTVKWLTLAQPGSRSPTALAIPGAPCRLE